ncbi:PAS domain S-box protein, partial [Alienimonas sp. DA493]|uniref:PAS domain S-box protein n=1 Tax=Alienimonas sp. DA493 TaxID=3373605 RepID=UPI0037545D3F
MNDFAPPAARPAEPVGSGMEFAAALARAADLAAGADSPEGALEAGVELICELTGWPLGHVVLPPPGGDGGREAELRDTNIWHLAAGAADGAALAAALDAAGPGPLPGGSGPQAPTAAGRAFAAARPVWRPLSGESSGKPEEGNADNADGPAADGPIRAALAGAGLRGAFAAPIVVDGAVAAVCEFFTPHPPPLEGAEGGEGEADESAVEAARAGSIAAAVGRQVAAALTQTRTAARLAAREDDLDDLFETAAAGIVLLEPDGTIRRSNRAFAHSLGRSPGSLAGRPITELFAPNGRGGGPLLAAARSGRPLLGHEADFLTAGPGPGSPPELIGEDGGPIGGEVRTLLIDADARRPPPPPGPGEAPNRPAPPGDGDGKGADGGGLFVGPVLRCFTRDVTARRRREQDRNRLAEIVRATPDAVTSKDLRGVLQTWNEGAVRMYGHPADFALGKTAPELGIVPPELAEEDRRLMATAAAGRRVEQFQTKRVRADGVRIDVSLTVGPVRDAAGRVVGAAFVARDITEQKRAAEELERATSRAEQASRAKTEFLANVSHELRTPMSAILGFTELAADEPLPAHVLDWLGTVRESADHLLALLNEILDFSRIESRRFELDPAPFSPREVVEETVRSLAPVADRKGLELTGSVGRGVPEALTGDPVRLRQILTNLTGNAVKFTDRGRVAVRIERDDADEPEPAVGEPVRLHVTVQDTGPGIAADDRERVFQPFAQADSTATRKHGGTGLGLSITHRLVGLMGGTVWMESVSEDDLPEGARRTADGVPATGTTFHVALTLPAADPATVSTEGTAADVPQDLAPKLRGLPVLVVDASPENRRLLCEALESWQMAPVTASTAQEAHEMVAAAAAEGHAFPLVLADAALAGLPSAGRSGRSGRTSDRANGSPRSAVAGTATPGAAKAESKNPGAGPSGKGRPESKSSGSPSSGSPSSGSKSSGAKSRGGLVAEAAAAGGAGVVLVTADGRR